MRLGVSETASLREPRLQASRFCEISRSTHARIHHAIHPGREGVGPVGWGRWGGVGGVGPVGWGRWG